MPELKVLFVSGSLGLGHVSRDIAIAQELRKQISNIDIKWLAVHPATLALENAGEKVLPEASKYVNENMFAEKSSSGAKLNLLHYLLKSKNAWEHNINVFADIVSSQHFDLLIGDETYEISLALRERPELKKFPFVMIFDFVGLESMSKNPLEKLGVHIYNRKWSAQYRQNKKPSYDLGLFVGELEDIPDTSFGFGMPNRRVFAKAMYNFVGYIFPFNPSDYMNKTIVREKLGYGSEPLLIASIGGTAIGKEVLELCSQAFTLYKKDYSNAKMVLITGPRIDSNTLKLPDNVEVKQFVPNLYEHFAASDLAIVQGGATSTLELTALKKPFIYFPIEGHCEQAVVARNLRRRGAGIQMQLSKTTPSILAEKIFTVISSSIQYPEIPTDGAQKAAQLISRLLESTK